MANKNFTAALPVAAIALVALLSSVVAAFSLNYSCPVADSTSARTVTDSARFNWLQNQYEVKTTGIMFPALEQSGGIVKHCMEFTVTNMSESRIETLSWPYAHIKYVDLIPNGPPAEMAFDLFSCYKHDDQEQITPIHAFRNSQASVRSPAPINWSIAPAALRTCGTIQELSSESGLVSFDLAAVPEFDAGSLDGNILHMTLPAYLISEELRTLPPLTSRFSSGEMEVTVSSGATHLPSDGVITLEHFVSFSGVNEGQGRLFSPHLRAIQEGSQSLDTFVAALAAKGDPLLKGPEEFTWSGSFPVEPGQQQPALFVVQHPVTVIVDDAATCFVVQSYSSFPVSTASEELCAE